MSRSTRSASHYMLSLSLCRLSLLLFFVAPVTEAGFTYCACQGPGYCERSARALSWELCVQELTEMGFCESENVFPSAWMLVPIDLPSEHTFYFYETLGSTSYLPSLGAPLTLRFSNGSSSPTGQWRVLELELIDDMANGGGQERFNSSSIVYVLPSIVQFATFPFNGSKVMMYLEGNDLIVTFCDNFDMLYFSFNRPVPLTRKEIALIVCGTLLCVALIVILIVVLVRRRRRKKGSYSSI